MSDHDAGGLLIFVGLIILTIAMFFPKLLPFVPGNRWFPPWGPTPSRFGSAVGAVTCVLVGLNELHVIRQEYIGVVVVVWGSVVVAAALYDYAKSGETEDDQPSQK